MNNSNFPRAWAEIDLPAFERNIGKIKAELPNKIRYISVVKADAYGHGVGHIVERLLQCGVYTFAVANAREGSEVRFIAPKADIMILGPSFPEEIENFFDDHLIYAVSNKEEIILLNKIATSKNQKISINLKIDTGMGRMGIWHENAMPLIKLIEEQKNLNFFGIFTHFSCADTDLDFTKIQRKRFLKIIESIPEQIRKKLLIHSENSAALDTFSSVAPFNAVRVGILQYGLPPSKGSLFSKIAPEPVLSFHSRIGLIKDLPKGATISYNKTKILDKPTKIAIATAGYADGIPTSASNRAYFILHGKKAPVLGRVTMDQTILDISDIPEAQTGDIVTIIGNADNTEVSMSKFCEWGECIPWETLVSITKRVPRIYKELRIIA